MYENKSSRANVRILSHRRVPFTVRRPAGRLYLPVPGQSVCQRTDRQYRAAQRQPDGWQLGAGAALSGAVVRLCAGGAHRRKNAGALPGDAHAPLAAAGGAGRRAAAVPRGLSAAGAEPAGQRHRLVCLRHAGAGFPQGGWLRLCQHHVHR